MFSNLKDRQRLLRRGGLEAVIRLELLLHVVLGNVLHQDPLVHLRGELVAALVALDHPRPKQLAGLGVAAADATAAAAVPPAAATAAAGPGGSYAGPGSPGVEDC